MYYSMVIGTKYRYITCIVIQRIYEEIDVMRLSNFAVIFF